MYHKLKRKYVPVKIQDFQKAVSQANGMSVFIFTTTREDEVVRSMQTNVRAYTFCGQSKHKINANFLLCMFCQRMREIEREETI